MLAIVFGSSGSILCSKYLWIGQQNGFFNCSSAIFGGIFSIGIYSSEQISEKSSSICKIGLTDSCELITSLMGNLDNASAKVFKLPDQYVTSKLYSCKAKITCAQLNWFVLNVNFNVAASLATQSFY